jgi:3'-5' exoribonuclease
LKNITQLYAGQTLTKGQASAILSKFEMATTKTGDSYAKISLQFPFGNYQGNIWGRDLDPGTKQVGEEFIAMQTKLTNLMNEGTPEALEQARLTPPIIVAFEGTVSEFNGSLQLTAKNLTKISADPMDYFYSPITAEKALELKAELMGYVSQVTDEGYATILRYVLNDPIVARDFFLFPAATGHHHAYKYGLLFHTLEVLRYALALYDAAPNNHEKLNISRDLIIAGSILHDLGKIEEYRYFVGNNITTYNNSAPSHLASSIAIIREIMAAVGLRDKYLLQKESIGAVCNLHHGVFGLEKEYNNTDNYAVKLIHFADNASASLAPALEEIWRNENSLT